MSSKDSALVLFSGGQDSTVCLAWALQTFTHVETIGFDYGQRHLVEMECRLEVLKAIRESFPKWSEKLGEDHVVDLDVLNKLSDTALTRDTEIELNAEGLPNTFVPGRNLLFFTFAAALAYRRGISHMVGGMCETDYSGYPDCRDTTLRSLQKTLSLGMDKEFVIDTPLMWLDKAATWKKAEELGDDALVAIIIEKTHTCYAGDRTQKHEWGYGCGECPACRLRAKGYREYTSSR